MELSLFLAKLLGLTMSIFTLTALFRSNFIGPIIRELKTTSLAVFVTSFVAILGGLAIVLSHNIWEMNWRGLITFFGWASLIKGVSFIAFPELMIKAADKIMAGNSRKVWLAVSLIVSLYLVSKGFGN